MVFSFADTGATGAATSEAKGEAKGAAISEAKGAEGNILATKVERMTGE